MSASFSRTPTSTDLTGAAKLEDVTRIMKTLSLDLEESKLEEDKRDLLLDRLKVYGRDPTNAQPIFTKEGIRTLTRYAFESTARTASLHALRVLANALLLKPDTRKTFLDLGCAQKACKLLQNDDRDYEFLASRLIFLTTYTPKPEIESLIDEQGLAESVCRNIETHAKHNGKTTAAGVNPLEDMALTESLKLLFNLTNFCPQRSSSFSPALPHILQLIVEKPIPTSRPLDPPIGPLVNSLLNIPLDSEDATIVFPETTPNTHIERLVEILEHATDAYEGEDLEQLVTPLVTLLRRIYGIANDDAKKYAQSLLLPSSEDRVQPLGKSSSLSSQLLRLSTNPTTPQLRKSISSLLYELSEKNPQTFVENVGYGFASGFLFQHNIPVPPEALKGESSKKNGGACARTDTNGYQPGKVNPVTGQFLDKEPQIEEDDMTQEEKEREAERLFVLFERLKKTGVMNVENPVATAYQQGRFEELDDDADSD